MIRENNKKEETFNTITHSVGIIFGIIGLILLLMVSIKEKNITKIISFSIYGVCIIVMFLSSTLYHSISTEKAKSILRVFDHASIFIFIAGTYTPIVTLTQTGGLRVLLLVGIWAIALFGVVFKIFTYGKFDRYKGVSLVLYIGMGWIAIFPIRAIINATSINFFYWILAGGLLYTVGTIFYGNRKISLNHGIWHLFVLGASVVHFVGIYFYLA
ncbi:MAG: hemolysin III family protein [Erysipelotrichaceae bacterium]|nr:hemolysin III family protein [Erysipelotrichaceae bacterium]MDD4642615.1 hemolysin III family protein [Erysipelotrichaceae bacterium]